MVTKEQFLAEVMQFIVNNITKPDERSLKYTTYNDKCPLRAFHQVLYSGKRMHLSRTLRFTCEKFGIEYDLKKIATFLNSTDDQIFITK